MGILDHIKRELVYISFPPLCVFMKFNSFKKMSQSAVQMSILYFSPLEFKITYQTYDEGNLIENVLNRSG